MPGASILRTPASAALALLLAGAPTDAPAPEPPLPPVQSIRVPMPPQHGTPAIVRAAINGDFADLEVLFPKATPNLRYQAARDAIWKDRIDVLEWFLKKGLRTNPPDIGLEDLLAFAAASDDVAAIRLLCKYGADPDWQQPDDGAVALHFAVRDDEVSVEGAKTIAAVLDCGVKKLPPRADSIPGGARFTVPILHDVARLDDVTLVRRVLDLGAPIGERGGLDNRTVLFTRGMDMPITELLLSRGADARVLDAKGTSALAYVACHPGYQAGAVIRRLVKAGAPVDARDHSQDWYDVNEATPLICAAKFAQVDGVRALLAAGANPNLKDRNGRTAMGIIAEIEATASHSADYYLQAMYPREAHRPLHAQIVGLLASHGADPDLDPKVRENARNNGEVGRALIAALQPTFGDEVAACMQRRSPLLSPKAVDTPRARAPGREGYDRVRLTALPAAGPVTNAYSLSPDGRWLVYLREASSRNMGKGRTLVAYDWTRDASQTVTFDDDVYAEHAAWRRSGDAVRFLIAYDNYAVAELGARARRGTNSGFEPPARAGGDPCGTRDENGTLAREPGSWDPDGDYRLRHPLTGGAFKIVAQPPGADLLVLEEPLGTRTLARHDRQWYRKALRENIDKERLEFEKMAAAHKGPDIARLREVVAKMAAEKESALEQGVANLRLESSFQLAPSGRYLYYQFSTHAGGWGGSRRIGRRFVVSLEGTTPQVWEIAEAVTAAQWHPNGRELAVIVAEHDADGKHTGQHLAVARFP